jgi:hypothetical protein
MPNLDFYAAGSDRDAVVDLIFSQPGCRIFESYSRPSQDIVEFTSPDHLRAALRSEPVVGQDLMQIAPPQAPFQIRRFALRPELCHGHTFRHTIEGWGLIQFHLGGTGPDGVIGSHTNHNSVARARAWEPTYPDWPGVEQWDWKSVAFVSSRLNRMIRKLAVAKIGSRPVLPSAAALIASGTPPAGFGSNPPPLQFL